MLFSLAHWHGLAKLRMHSDATLAILDTWTHTLGEDVRNFESQTCRHFGTVELDKEYAARQRRKAKKKSAGNPSSGEKEPATSKKTATQAQPGPSHNTSSGPLTIRIPPLAPKASSKKVNGSKGKRKKPASAPDLPHSKRLKTTSVAPDSDHVTPKPPNGWFPCL
jgi:hypothetical protein